MGASYARSGQDGLAFDSASVIGRLTVGHSTPAKAIAGLQTTVLNDRFTLMPTFAAPRLGGTNGLRADDRSNVTCRLRMGIARGGTRLLLGVRSASDFIDERALSVGRMTTYTGRATEPRSTSFSMANLPVCSTRV